MLVTQGCTQNLVLVAKTWLVMQWVLKVLGWTSSIGITWNLLEMHIFRPHLRHIQLFWK